LFPCLVAIIGSWFAKTHRGVFTGTYGTSTNSGNILGIQFSAAILSKYDQKW